MPWQLISKDFLGPIEGEGFVLVVRDLYSRFYEVAITKRKDSKTIIKVLRKLFYTHGYPETLMSNNAAEIQSVEILYRVFLYEHAIL